jgi:divalent metal cation (Fe/Co/Zn/Cd) transporter
MPPLEIHARAAQRAHQSARLVLRGILLNAVLALVKLAGGILGHTYALVADAAESMLDILTSLLVWTGFKVAARCSSS